VGRGHGAAVRLWRSRQAFCVHQWSAWVEGALQTRWRTCEWCGKSEQRPPTEDERRTPKSGGLDWGHSRAGPTSAARVQDDATSPTQN
jgi:hypothetical protein